MLEICFCISVLVQTYIDKIIMNFESSLLKIASTFIDAFQVTYGTHVITCIKILTISHIQILYKAGMAAFYIF